ncbi:MAG TPA: PIG-L family deacetylase [Polyangiaceae bacterium]|nr:PIG-L family deacetylase [Polyangiaceae bacterium]
MTLRVDRPDSDVFVPDGSELGHALARTTHLGVGAHQDDLELMAIHGILECFRTPERWFTGVVVTDGRGSPQVGGGGALSDSELGEKRRLEQRRAATLGQYSAQIQLGFPSRSTKSRAPGERAEVVLELEQILRATRPEVVYTHNLADKHDTHVAVTLRLLDACRRLPADERPARVIGCEVWRDLDWLVDADKVALPVDGEQELQVALIGVFESQIAGGKRYDLASLGRRQAHATFSDSHEIDRHSAVVYGMDLTPLLAGGEPVEYTLGYVQRLADEIRERIARLG